VIDLASCSTVFDAEHFYLFWGQGDRVDVIAGPLELSGIENMTQLAINLESAEKRRNLDLQEPEAVSVAMKLAPSMKPPTHVVGALVPLGQAAWLKRLVYLLPSSALRGHRIAVTDRGVLLVAEKEVDVIPLGALLVELAPGLLIPAGMDLVPRVAPGVLAATLGHGAGVLTVFPADAPPFQVAESELAPLERRALAKVEVDQAQTLSMAASELDEPSVRNDPVGRFALWGFSTPPDK
jgi:hypothetical protein